METCFNIKRHPYSQCCGVKKNFTEKETLVFKNFRKSFFFKRRHIVLQVVSDFHLLQSVPDHIGLSPSFNAKKIHEKPGIFCMQIFLLAFHNF